MSSELLDRKYNLYMYSYLFLELFNHHIFKRLIEGD